MVDEQDFLGKEFVKKNSSVIKWLKQGLNGQSKQCLHFLARFTQKLWQAFVNFGFRLLCKAEFSCFTYRRLIRKLIDLPS